MDYQLTAFEVGQVKAHMEHGLGAAAISQIILKADGRNTFSDTAIRNCMRKLRENPRWRGEREEGSGAPRKTTTAQDKQIIRWLLREQTIA